MILLANLRFETASAMPDTFDCPKCEATYTREKRRIGKAVVCVCGHKFLVPPPETEPPRRAAYESPPRAHPRSTPSPTRSRLGSLSDSSGEVVPLRQPSRSTPPNRWADPADLPEAELIEEELVEAELVEAEPEEPLMEAEVVYSADDRAAPDPAQDLFGDGAVYGAPISSEVPLTPLPAWSRPAAPAVRDARPKHSTKRPPCPAGVIVLALLYFLAAGLLVTVGIVVGGAFAMMVGPVAGVGLLVCFFIAALIVAAGVGMLMGAKWAWWLSSFGNVHSICNGVASILLSMVFANRMMAGAAVFVFARVFVRMMISGAILAYLLNDGVLAFFRFKRLDPGQALAILFGLAVTLNVVLYVAVYLLLRAQLAA